MAQRVQEFSIEGIEELFSPRGLPLTAKGLKGTQPATSILVRGGAGVGKTTLALALAHGVAKHLDGAVLYLGTEFVSTEIKFKGAVLGVKDVKPWIRRAEARSGSIVVQHLSAEVDPALASTPASLKRNAVDVAWRLIEKNVGIFRAVVIDAFISPHEGADDPGLRDAILRLVQALEAKGVSAILVQEESESLDWLAFVVDVVVGLAFVEDQDTREVQRKLTLEKSRYSMSHVGPHDYGLDNDRPAVWPNLLAVVYSPTAGGTRLPAPGIILAVDGTEAVVLRSGGLILSDESVAPKSALLNVLEGVPGGRCVDIRCGPITQISVGGTGIVSVPDWEGPFSIGWAAFRIARKNDANILRIFRLESLIDRPRFAVGLQHVLEAFVQCGALVCLHGKAETLIRVFGSRLAFANRGPRQQGVQLARPGYLGGVRWLEKPLPEATPPVAAGSEDRARAAQIRKLLKGVDSSLRAGTTASRGRAPPSNTTSPPSSRSTPRSPSTSRPTTARFAT